MSLHCESHVISLIGLNQGSSVSQPASHISTYLGNTDALDVREVDCQRLNQAIARHEARFRTTFENLDSPSE